jgi:hypothetical protein
LSGVACKSLKWRCIPEARSWPYQQISYSPEELLNSRLKTTVSIEADRLDRVGLVLGLIDALFLDGRLFDRFKAIGVSKRRVQLLSLGR